MKSFIVLITDFSYSDGYIGAMKGVILSINPDAKIIDLAHNLPKFNIRYAGFILYSTFRYFPKRSIFVGVIDPGVGTERDAIVLETENYFFIGPNNGLFSLILEEEKVVEARKITNREIMLPNVSTTFHGRDIFAPAAAYLSLGFPLEKIGPKLSNEQIIKIPHHKPLINAEKHEYRGEVLAVDSFGNIITNIPNAPIMTHEKLSSKYSIYTSRGIYTARLVKSYGYGQKDELLLIPGSHGFLEIAINQGSAIDRLRIKEGELIHLKLID